MSSEQQLPADDASSVRALAIDRMVVRDLTWRASPGGGVMLASFTVVNTGARSVRDPVIGCALSGPSGTVISTVDHALYERIGPGARVRVEDQRMGAVNPQSKSALCRVVSLTVEPSQAPQRDFSRPFPGKAP